MTLNNGDVNLLVNNSQSDYFIQEYLENSNESTSNNYEDVFIKYEEIFNVKFKELLNYFMIFDRDSVKKFLKDNDDLLLLLEEVNTIINNYFPDYIGSLELNKDPEFEELTQIVVYIHRDGCSFNEDWILLKQINKDIRYLNNFSFDIKKLVSVDLW